MTTVLVSGASGIVGYGILRSLRMSGRSLKLIGASIYDDSVAPAFCDCFELAPRTDAPGYLEWLLDTLSRHQVEAVVPGIEIDLYKWIDHVPEIAGAGAVPLLNNLDLIRRCQDKWKFYEDLCAAGLDCAIPSSLDTDFNRLVAQFGLPLLLKPRRGFASKGIVRVHDRETFDAHRSAIGPVLMVQPLIGSDDAEFTTAAFGDGQGGFAAVMTLKRTLSRDGYTDKAEVVPNEEFLPAVSMLCRRYAPVGPTNFQFRRSRSGAKLLEINPRVSSSTAIRSAFGYNESAMALDYFLDHRLPTQPVIRPGRAVRYTDEHIFYGDRTHL
jgi:carbamoyl-phosphate synthase large subunit